MGSRLYSRFKCVHKLQILRECYCKTAPCSLECIGKLNTCSEVQSKISLPNNNHTVLLHQFAPLDS